MFGQKLKATPKRYMEIAKDLEYSKQSLKKRTKLEDFHYLTSKLTL